MHSPKIVISIPAFNDSLSLLQLVEATIQHLNRIKLNYSIFIVNDGSTDNTQQIIDDLQRKYQFITSCTHKKNLGFGETLRKVFKDPEGDWVLFLPGDHQFPIENIDRFLKLINEFDFIIGFRKKRNDSMNRKIYSYIYNILITYTSGYEVNDVNSIVFFKKSLLDKVDLKSNSAFIHAELFIKCMNKKAKAVEIDVIHHQRSFGKGAGGNLKVISATLKDVLLFHLGKF